MIETIAIIILKTFRLWIAYMNNHQKNLQELIGGSSG
jgi:hypothetical protein